MGDPMGTTRTAAQIPIRPNPTFRRATHWQDSALEAITDGAESLSFGFESAIEVPPSEIIHAYRIFAQQQATRIIGPSLDVLLNIAEDKRETLSALFGEFANLGISTFAGTHLGKIVENAWDSWRRWCSALRLLYQTGISSRCSLVAHSGLSIEECCAQIVELRSLISSGANLSTIVIIPHRTHHLPDSLTIEESEVFLRQIALTRLGLGNSWPIEVVARTSGIALAELAPAYGASRISREASEASFFSVSNDSWEFLVRQLLSTTQQQTPMREFVADLN